MNVLRKAWVLVRRLPRSVLFYVATAALVALVFHQIDLVGDFRVDDAYISFSFSKNLATGHGPVFSHGVKVEGYSNFLWVVLVAVGSFFHRGVDYYPVARVLALTALVLAAVFTYRMVRRFASRWAAFLAVGLVLSSTDVIRAMVSGLETVPYMAALVYGWHTYLREPKDARRYSLLAFLPAALLRINGFIPMLVLIGFEVVSSLAERRFSLRRLLIWAGPAVGLYAAYFSWRWGYYGLLFPSTYYAKQFVAINEPNRGFDQAYAFLRESAAIGILPLMFLPLVRGPKREGWALIIAVAVQVAYSVYVGGDWMPFQRFFLPIFPLSAALAAWGAQALVDSARRTILPLRLALGATLIGVFGLVGVYGYAGSVDTDLERHKLGEAKFSLQHTRDNLLGIRDLIRHLIRKPGDRVVTDYAGVFGFFTDAYVIDMWGLCTAEIALEGGTLGINPIYGKECAECYVDLKPDYFHVMVPLARSPNAFANINQVIAKTFQGGAIDRHLHFRQNFAVGRIMDLRSPNRTFWFLERRRPEYPLVPRQPSPRIRIDYPFEPAR
jgi:hypothetical protein